MTKPLNRRTALGRIVGVAALAFPAAALAIVPAMPMAGEDPVYAAIRAHKEALDDFSTECIRQSDLEFSEENEAIYAKLSQAEIDALIRVARTIPTTEKGAKAALAHLIREGDEGRYDDLFERFAASLIVAKWRV